MPMLETPRAISLACVLPRHHSLNKQLEAEVSSMGAPITVTPDNELVA